MDLLFFKLAAQILFSVVAIIFLVYSIIALYALNTYSQSKNAATTLSIIYLGASAGILGWGFIIFLAL